VGGDLIMTPLFLVVNGRIVGPVGESPPCLPGR
jgi:hypothetical protein